MNLEEKIERGLEMAAARWTERNEFLSDDDVLDITDALCPCTFDGVATLEEELAQVEHDLLSDALFAALTEEEDVR